MVRLNAKASPWVAGGETRKCSRVGIPVAPVHSAAVNHEEAIAGEWTHHSSAAARRRSFEDLGQGHTSVLVVMGKVAAKNLNFPKFAQFCYFEGQRLGGMVDFVYVYCRNYGKSGCSFSE